MPYYITPQIIEEHRDEHGVVISTTIRPQLPGGVGWRGDTDGVNYLVFVDRELPPGGLYRGVPVAELAVTLQEMAANRVKMGRQPISRAAVDIWARGLVQATRSLGPAPSPDHTGGP